MRIQGLVFFYGNFGGNPSFSTFLVGFRLWRPHSTFLRGGQSDPQMKYRERRDASNGIKYRSPSMSNTVIFGENYPYLVTLWILFYLLGWRWFRRSVLSVFRWYLSHLTCGRVHFCCNEIRINSRSVWSENYFAPPILVRPYFFTFEIFQVFSTNSDSPVCDILLKCVSRFTLAIQISKPWGAKAPPGVH